MHPEKQQQRGFNQAELIATAFCRQTGLPQVKGLNRRRNTAPQFGLSAIDRAANLANAFEIGAFFSGKNPLKSRPTVLLLDDIYTTGATAQAAAQTLRRHQISVYGILAIAKTDSSADG
jgi:predicted amidophosphoribosyltransferase